MSEVCRQVLISGTVQGVGFRASTLRKATALGLKGWVRNLNSGEVEVMVQGTKDKVEELVKWCATGPQGSEVNNVLQRDLPLNPDLEPFILRAF